MRVQHLIRSSLKKGKELMSKMIIVILSLLHAFVKKNAKHYATANQVVKVSSQGGKYQKVAGEFKTLDSRGGYYNSLLSIILIASVGERVGVRS